MSGGGNSGPLVPTFHGFVQNSMDGLMLFEACLSGKLHHVPRRPHDRERANLIKSGSVFIYEENASGIKRWTDGVAWSPSRILGNFLIYRELEKPFPPGEKKRAMKRKRSSQIEDGVARRNSDEGDSSQVDLPLTPPTPKLPQEADGAGTAHDSERELDRQLIGSLVDSYGFRPDGLVKKTMSITMHGVSHHLVSYYKVEDVKSNRLPRPSEDGRLQGVSIRPDLYLKQNFRTPVEDTDHYVVDPQTYRARPNTMPYHPQYVMPGGYPMRPGPYAPAPPPGYQLQATAMYAPPPQGAQWGAPPQHMSPSPYSHQAYQQPNHLAQQQQQQQQHQHHPHAGYADYYTTKAPSPSNVQAQIMPQHSYDKYQAPPPQ